MKRTNKIMIFTAALLIFSFMAATSQAGHGLYGHRFHGSPYAQGNIPTPPYYALHPPVYYSHPVARPYGQSPFACRCGEQVKVSPAAKTVFNPHLMPTPASRIKPSADEECEVDRTAASGQVIINPFYRERKQDGRVARFSAP